MSDPTTITHPDLVRAIVREGCALRLLRDVSARLFRAGETVVALGPAGILMDGWGVETDIGPVPLDALAVDLTRASGQWAAAMWICTLEPAPNDRAGYPLTDFGFFVVDAFTGSADPAELRRVVYEIAGVSDAT